MWSAYRHKGALELTHRSWTIFPGVRAIAFLENGADETHVMGGGDSALLKSTVEDSKKDWSQHMRWVGNLRYRHMASIAY